MLTFRKWLEFSDLGGEVSYNHINNVSADDAFNKVNSKWMAGSKLEKPLNINKIFGKKKIKTINKV